MIFEQLSGEHSFESSSKVSISEAFVRGKSASMPKRCEDRVVVNDNFIAVIDGMSSPGINEWPSPGVTAALAVAQAFEALPAAAEPAALVASANAILAPKAANWQGRGLVGAVFAAVSISRAELWLLGDCQARVAAEFFSQPKVVDQLSCQLRALLLEAAVANPLTVLEPLYRAQQNLANRAGEFGYPAVTGQGAPVITVVPIPLGADAGTEVILATDGYPVLASSLAACEQLLWSLLQADPACSGALRSMGKSPASPGDAPDDRAFIRFTFKGEK